MSTINVYQLVDPATMYRNRFALKAVFDYAWRGSHEVEVDKTTGFLYVRRKGITATGLPIIEEKAKQKVQQLLLAFDAACAKHKELQKTGVKELFGNMKLIASKGEIVNNRFFNDPNQYTFYFHPQVLSAKGEKFEVINAEISLVFSDKTINSLSYEWLPVKSKIEEALLPPAAELKNTGIFYRFNSNKLLATPYYAY
jgi:hypothetical protein